LKNLRRKDNIYLPSDKGGEFCVIEKDRYTQLALAHLQDTTTYKPIPHIVPSTIEKRVNNVWNDICHSNEIPKHIRRSYTTSNSRMPIFYCLIKTHKRGLDVKIRPIVSNSNGPTFKLAWLLSRILKPLLSYVPAHLENSFQLIERIQRRNQSQKEQYKYPFSLDVVSLYTSIPPAQAVMNLEQMMFRHEYQYPPFSHSDISDILHVTLNNTYFRFANHIFQQTSGLAMGSSVSAILSILFMNSIENQALTTFTGLSCYSRYVDDVFALVQDREAADQLLGTMNSVHENIKFEIEHPSQTNSLSLLDFTVTIDTQGEAAFKFYRKPARSNVFMNARTALPSSIVHNVVKNERRRIIERCTSIGEAKQRLQNFERMLAPNDHQPNNSLHSRPLTSTHPRRLNNETFFIQLPFDEYSEVTTWR
jgi:hypothetical protein